MKVLEINSVLYGSTGKIALQIAEVAKRHGYDVRVCVPKGRHNSEIIDDNIIYFGNRLSEDSHLALSRLTGLNGYFSIIATQKLIKKIEAFNPDIIQLHNLHNSYINISMLFAYIKKKDIPVVWTFHDCWPFTGKCPHFTVVECEKWKTGCYECKQYKTYPRAYVDNTRFLWKDKKRLFLGVSNMTIVTPSKWLCGLVKESFLQQYRVEVINNGIDLNIFKPTNDEFRKKNHLDNRKIVLGVASVWGKNKGLDVFYRLASDLPDEYIVVLVGIESNKHSDMPSNIIGINRTENQEQLADIYSCADVFVNPTLEDNFPTVNLEALACGTPVITYDTGGSSESIDVKCGCVIPRADYDSLKKAIIYTVDNHVFSQSDCVMKAKEYSAEDKYEEYIELYENCSRSTKRSV